MRACVCVCVGGGVPIGGGRAHSREGGAHSRGGLFGTE